MALDQLMTALQGSSLRSEERRRQSQTAIAQMISKSIANTQANADAAMQAAASAKVSGGGVGPSTGAVGNNILAAAPGQLGKINPHAGMATINVHGMKVTVNKTAAPRFKGFLNALWKTGYRPKSVGGYSVRNIAGTNTKSLHSYGLAIDIDPASNPVTYGTIKTTLPKGVGKLANKYGLEWGGNWNGSKKDTMHFSVPWFGTK